MLKELCSVCNYSDDGFIGIQFQDGVPHVSFPRGYSLSENDDNIRKDILSLIAVLQRFSKHREGKNISGVGETRISFPILAYQYLIQDFITHGYYSEREVKHTLSDHGKINWKRTIQQVRPQIDNDNVVYLDFVTKRSINSTNIITRIHEYCVYESFSKLGWLFLSTGYLPQKPRIKFNRRMFLSTLNDALKNTYNSEKKRLFSCMIDVVNNIEENSLCSNFQFGVSRFEYVWENIIDYVFGENNKEVFFPHAKWHIIQGSRVESSALEPDTIMMLNGKIFILDAKYYKFGVTGNALHLPATASIQKQITYGDYIAKCQFADRNNIYNAFVMPFEADFGEEPLKFVSVGTADWIDYSDATENYKYVLGILLDTKYLISTYTRHSGREILRASQLIIESLQMFRTGNNNTLSQGIR